LSQVHRHHQNKIMLRKIITYFLILAVVLPVLASAIPLGASINVALAESVTNEGSNNGEISSPCGWTAGLFSGDFLDCIAYTAVYISYEFFLQISIWITGLASDIFNVSIQFSLTGKAFDPDENVMIKDGWTMVRDLLNLVFIFILLYAAISTILQYGNMDIKKILPSLIIAALLINFSMLITKMVIDASHIFAWEFYNQIDVTKGGTVANMKGSAEVYGDFEKKNLSNVFLAGFNPQRLLIEAEMATTTTNENGNEDEAHSPWKQVAAKAIENGEGFMSTLWRMAIIIWLEIALAIFSVFILLAGAIMFVARIVILWAVMIFSPIAFLEMILPSMKQYSEMWWKYLIGQSFFAPAFLFMFMLATKFINSGFVDKLLHLTKDNDSKIVTGLSMGEITLMFFNFLIVGGIMSLCLVVARQLGGKTAEFGINWAHKGKDLALSGAKKLAWSPTRYGLRLGGGAAADAILKGEGRISGALKAIPGVGIGLRKLGIMKKADEDKERKAAEKYAGTLSSAGRTSLDKDKERGFVGRAMYGGGLFKPTREGYEKIIEKKKVEGEERGRIADKMIELMGSKFDEFASGFKKGDAKEKIKAILLRGNTEELDKWIELEDKKVEGENEKKIDEKNEIKRGFDNKIKEINDKLTIARNKSENTDELMKKLLGTEKEAYENNKKLIEIIGKEKHRENLQKTIDKYEGKQVYKSGKPEDKKEEKKKD